MHISLSPCLLVKLYKKGQNYHLFYILPSILALRASYRLSVGCRPSLRRILARWVFTLDSVLLRIIQILPNLHPLNINCAILRSDGVRSGKVCSIRSPVEASASNCKQAQKKQSHIHKGVAFLFYYCSSRFVF